LVMAKTEETQRPKVGDTNKAADMLRPSWP
jgi:hypothetical protein